MNSRIRSERTFIGGNGMNLKAKFLCMFALFFGSMMLVGCWFWRGVPTARVESGAKGAVYPRFVANAGIENLRVDQVDAWPMRKLVGEFEAVTRTTYLWGVASRDRKKMVDNITYGEVPPHYASNDEAPALVPGVLYYCETSVSKGDPRMWVTFWFYMCENDLGQIKLRQLTADNTCERVFLEADLVLDEDEKILKIVPVDGKE